MRSNTHMSANNFDQSDLHNDTSFSSYTSSSPVSAQPFFNQENDSGCGSDDDRTLARKINKGLAMGYDYELIKSVIEQQNNNDDMSKFIETIVRTAEVTHYSVASPPPITNGNDYSEGIYTPHDVYIIDGVDLAFSDGNNSFSWRGIEICLKYFHSHGHKKVFIALPYSLKHQQYERDFSESKILRDVERKKLLIYTNRMAKPPSKATSHNHISEMLKFAQKHKGYVISNVSLRDVLLDFTVYKQTVEEKVIRYRFEHESFQPLLVLIVNDNEGNDCERYYPLCPYGKKCTYGSKCKYFHIECRQHQPLSVSKSQYKFNRTQSSPDQLHMYTSSLADDARMTYEYGLTSISISNDSTFVDQRCSPIQTCSIPQEQNCSIAQFEQNVLRYFSILSQPVQQEYLSVNSQEVLANRIQSVRHLWETEDSSH